MLRGSHSLKEEEARNARHRAKEALKQQQKAQEEAAKEAAARPRRPKDSPAALEAQRALEEVKVNIPFP